MFNYGMTQGLVVEGEPTYLILRARKKYCFANNVRQIARSWQNPICVSWVTQIPSIPWFRIKCTCASCGLVCTLDILFTSNYNIHKSLCGHCFWASYPLIDGFYKYLSIKGSEAQKQKPCELLWMLWFDEKSISTLFIS